GAVSSWTDLPASIQERLIDAADALYVTSGFATGERDRARESSFREKVRRLFTTYDPALKPNARTAGVLFDGLAAGPAAEKLLRSKLSSNRLAELCGTSALRGPLTYFSLAFPLVIIAKNAHTAFGSYNAADVPVSSIMGLLKHFGIVVNG